MIPIHLFFVSTDFECINMVCGISDRKEGTDWGFYSLKEGNCRLCKKYCLADDNCQAVECGTSYCRWWKNDSCNKVSELANSNVVYLHTCLKHKIGILLYE